MFSLSPHKVTDFTGVDLAHTLSVSQSCKTFQKYLAFHNTTQQIPFPRQLWHCLNPHHRRGDRQAACWAGGRTISHPDLQSRRNGFILPRHAVPPTPNPPSRSQSSLNRIQFVSSKDTEFSYLSKLLLQQKLKLNFHIQQQG